MKCPTCPDSTLMITERSGVEIDYCPACRGVWLDRGELDKLLDRSADQPVGPGSARYVRRDDDSVDEYPDEYRRRNEQGHPPRKRKGWLGEFFDF